MSVESQSSADKTYETDPSAIHDEYDIPRLDEIWGTKDGIFVKVDGEEYGRVEVAAALDEYKREIYGSHFGPFGSSSQEGGEVPDKEEVVRLLEEEGYLQDE